MTSTQAFALFMLAGVLSGCGSAEQQDLRQWMREQRAQTRPQVQPIAAPTVFIPQAYTQQAVTDPFSNQKLTQALKRDIAQSPASGALIAPELARRKEPLEAFPLDAMTMVGSLARRGQPVALVRVDNLIYQVRPGNYLGQNYGRITKVGESEIVLREIVQDATGEWIERKATLQLQDRQEKSK